MSHRPLLAGVGALGLVMVAVAAVAVVVPSPPAPIDLRREPVTIFETQPFPVGVTYTLGTLGVPTFVPRPVTITRIEVLHRSGVEIVGLGSYSPVGEGVGLVRGWPPAGIEVKAAGLDGPAWPHDAFAAIGLRITAQRSGFRGIRLTWIDGAGNTGSRVDDLAAYTCSDGACDSLADDYVPLLVELGLLRR